MLPASLLLCNAICQPWLEVVGGHQSHDSPPSLISYLTSVLPKQSHWDCCFFFFFPLFDTFSLFSLLPSFSPFSSPHPAPQWRLPGALIHSSRWLIHLLFLHIVLSISLCLFFMMLSLDFYHSVLLSVLTFFFYLSLFVSLLHLFCSGPPSSAFLMCVCMGVSVFELCSVLWRTTALPAKKHLLCILRSPLDTATTPKPFMSP